MTVTTRAAFVGSGHITPEQAGVGAAFANKGLTLGIVRSAYDCTGDGATALRFGRRDVTLVAVIKDFTVTGDRKDWITEVPRSLRVFATSVERPPVALVLRRPFGNDRIATIEPVTWDDRTGWVRRDGSMAGGHFAATSDSRFTELLEQHLGHCFYGAVPVHDRFEW